MQLETKAMEESARAIYETYFGKGTWGNAGAEQRGQARQAVRLVLVVLAKNSVDLSAPTAKTTGNDTPIKTSSVENAASPGPAPKPVTTPSTRATAPTAPGRRPGASRPPSPTLRR